MGKEGQFVSISVATLPTENFSTLLRARLKDAPWFLVSLAVHGVIALVLLNLTWQVLEPTVVSSGEIGWEKPKKIEPFEQTTDKPETAIPSPPQSLESPKVSETLPVEYAVWEEPSPMLLESREMPRVIGAGSGPAGSGFHSCRSRHAPGCGAATQRAIDWGLDWLARHQTPEGYWDSDGFALLDPIEDRCTGKGNPLNDVGVTGLALLAFLGAGHQPGEGEYSGVVKKGLRYLCDMQDPEDGCLTEKVGDGYVYCHAVACLALTEAYGLSRWPPLKKFVNKALIYVQQSRNPGRAWRYNSEDIPILERNDVSVTGWMVLCLASARDFGLPVEECALEDALAFLDEMTDPRTGRTGYLERGGFSARRPGTEEIWPVERGEAMTAVALFSRIFCGEALDRLEAQQPLLEKGARLLRASKPVWDLESGSIDYYYYWYYGTYAMFQLAGNNWKVWKDALLKAVLENQRSQGAARGSWDPECDPWGEAGGRIYATSLCLLSLEAFYRYDRILGSR